MGLETQTVLGNISTITKEKRPILNSLSGEWQVVTSPRFEGCRGRVAVGMVGKNTRRKSGGAGRQEGNPEKFLIRKVR